MYLKTSFIAIASLLIITSCKKEKNNDPIVDTTAPEMNVISPVNHQYYNVGDTVKIKVEWSDNIKLESAEIHLLDGTTNDYVLLLDYDRDHINAPQFTSDTMFIINNNTPKYCIFNYIVYDAAQNKTELKTNHIHIH